MISRNRLTQGLKGNKNTLLLFFVLIAILAMGCKETEKKEKKEASVTATAKAPNIIYFLADDLGYGEIGVHGQEKIKTPNIDALAANGMRFTQHYSGAPVCAPARCVFLTGKHMGHAYIRGNDPMRERGDIWDYVKAAKDPAMEGQRPIPDETLTIAEVLKKEGYHTGVFGKWGLGAPNTEGVPTKQGFDRFYGFNCQRQAHNLYPAHLWSNDEKVMLNNELIAPGTSREKVLVTKEDDPYDEANYESFTQKDYAPTLIHNEAVKFLKEQSADAPFFMYYATPLPHLPLQVPAEEMEFYRNQFGEEEPYTGEKGYFPNRYPRATYAAMITYLDKQLGELVQTLKEKNLYENTIIVFTSDNGPSYTGGVDYEFFNSSAPFTNGLGRTKGYVYEGGIRIPMIASWPGHIKAGTTSTYISAFYDMMPTFVDLAGADMPEGLDGVSLAPVLQGENGTERSHLYWEFPGYKGQQAVRMGKWKAVRKNIQEGNLEIELYNLEEDLQERKNIANEFPEMVQKMDSIFKVEHVKAVEPTFWLSGLGETK